MLAAEFVLGTLKGQARKRFQRLLNEDQSLDRVVGYWEYRLGQLGLDLTPVEPPDAVWQAIQRHVGIETSVQRPPVRSHGKFWQRAGFWRGWAALATAACVALAAVLWVVPAMSPQRAPFHYMSVMAPSKGQAEWVVMISKNRKNMRVKTISSSYSLPKHHSLELWILSSGQKKPVALGMMPKSGQGQMRVPPSARTTIGAHAKLALSVEPKGGSPTGQPTGPIVSVAQVIVMD